LLRHFLSGFARQKPARRAFLLALARAWQAGRTRVRHEIAQGTKQGAATAEFGAPPHLEVGGRQLMEASELKSLQAPLKARYREDPASAVLTLSASGALDDAGIACKVDTGRALIEAGLHPATGGPGTQACSGDMLLEALVACAGVTLKAVATALEFDLRGGTVHAEGDLDFAGTLGVAKDSPVGFKEIRLRFDLETEEPRERIETLCKLTERYCVVFQTLQAPPPISLAIDTRA
jgi:uncharacterized OsmC-like protein